MTPAQLSTLKAAILADSNLTALVAQGATGAIAKYLNAPSTSVVWQTRVATLTLYDAIIWASLTPADAPDGSALWLGRALACQGKQFNVQTILLGRDTINAAKLNIRAGLKDALTDLPSGSSGALRAAGWAAVQAAMQRFATNGEKVFAVGAGTAGSPSLLDFEGGVQDGDVIAALSE